MSRAKERLELARAHRERGGDRVLATVVHVEGSSYRKVGARALFSEGAVICGSISGGCLERDAAKRGAWLAQRGPTLVRYDATIEEAEEEGRVGLGCGGELAILVEAVGPEHPALEAIACAAEFGRPSRVVTVVGDGPRVGMAVAIVATAGHERVVASDGPESARRALEILARELTPEGPAVAIPTRVTLDGEDVPVLLERIPRPPAVLVCGAGNDAIPLVAFAASLGWQVTIADARASLLDATRFPAAKRCVVARDPGGVLAAFTDLDAAVVMTHSLTADRAWLEALAPRRDIGYVGALGPRARTEHLLSGSDRRAMLTDRLHAPAGLDLGGEGPEALALAIVAEMEAVRSGRSGGKLRDRR